jgi:MFS family permease
MTSASIVTAVTSSQLGRLSGRIAERVLVRIGFVAFAAGLGLIPVAPAPLALVVQAALLGFAFATTIPVVMTLLAGLAPDDRRAAFMSLNGTVLRLGQTIGPVAMTAMFAAGGFGAVYGSGAVIALGLAALMTVATRS